MSEQSAILDDVAKYYTGKLEEHGATPQGVDWNSPESQELRFAQLCKIIDKDEFSLNDLGCGYGALFGYLQDRHKVFSYYGADVSEEMAKAAEENFKGASNAHFHVSDTLPAISDYSIASGIFNVCLGHDKDSWGEYILKTLRHLHQSSARGFAFNCLTAYSDADKMRDDLYYADPLHLFDYCKKNFAKDVALLHDYGLYEFTILVRKAL